MSYPETPDIYEDPEWFEDEEGFDQDIIELLGDEDDYGSADDE